ncbi:2'-5' RNA ligase family protein [Rugosimonospora africana]|uniref:2'-5' RNA ligase n=1 Tax=Rugosimonospora africana TaxID=556532 RepID=A0A8J3R4A4_9ACTN|nr:2'-5' RNA ligase family protein [Rugosimonospora africana]GIH21622.1 2'-5' RNA ligase [Rugosimonospora africana]
MPYAIELFLDERADGRVRQIWGALDTHGISSLGSIPDTHYHPHVTLSGFDHGDPTQVARALRPVLVNSVGMPLVLESLGFFLTDEAPVFFGVVPSPPLLALHHAVHQVIEPLVAGIGPHYRPGGLLPHCTLAVGVSDRARVLDVVSRFPAPIPARAAGAHLVQVPGGHHSIQLTTA